MKKGLWILILIIILAAAAFVQFSSSFEKTPPMLMSPDVIYYNGKSDIKIKISDESIIKRVSTAYKNSKDSQFITMDNLQPNTNSITLSIKLPMPKFNEEISSYDLLITATDSSKWQWFMGNSSKKLIKVIIDRKPPMINVLANSYHIERGGAAGVVFYASDENLKDLYIESGSHKFKPSTFIKNGYFISLLAWDVKDDNYSANIIATDKAGNIARAHVPLYLSDRKYKVSSITVNNSFIDGKIKDLYETYASSPAASPAAMFDYVNATLRAQNEQLIHKASSVISDTVVNDFNIKPFLPLKNAAKVANFADHRFYQLNGEQISESWHMGIDLASIKMAPITLSNPGKLVFAQDNGIYGLNLLVDHGLGLYSLYGHCSKVNASVGDELNAGFVLANTGTSGLALGDHLHFGILVQGVEVRPEEWLDKKWINDNISSVIKKAKESIK